MDFSFWLRGLLIGLSIAAPVGPMGVLCIKRTLAQGRGAGFISGLGIATGDTVYGAIGGLGLTFISGFLVSQTFWLRLLGGLFLGYLGLKTWLAKPPENAVSAAQGKSWFWLYLSTFFLTLTNPTTILSFAAIMAGLGVGSTTHNYSAALLLVGGVFCGSTLWWLILSSGVSFFRAKFSAEMLSITNRISALIIVLFGIVALLSIF